jgi:hypothetical protein
VETLAQLGVLNEEEVAHLAVYHRPVVENRRGADVGEVVAVFKLTDQ